MEQLLTSEPKKIKGKIIVILLAIFALLSRGVGALIPMISSIIILVKNSFDYPFAHYFDLLKIPVFALMDALPFILFIVFVLFLAKKPKGTILLTITFGLVAANHVVYLLDNAITDIFYFIQNSDYIFESSEALIMTVVPNLVFGISQILVVVASALVIVGSFKGFKSKPLSIISGALGLGGYAILTLYNAYVCISGIFNQISAIKYYEETFVGTIYESIIDVFTEQCKSQIHYYSLSLASTLAVGFAFIAFFVALIILTANNRLPEIIKSKNPVAAEDATAIES